MRPESGKEPGRMVPADEDAPQVPRARGAGQLPQGGGATGYPASTSRSKVCAMCWAPAWLVWMSGPSSVLHIHV